MAVTIQGHVIQAGEATGELLVANEGLSFWGGYDYHTGNIVDQRHPLANQCAAGKILALPFTRGSSSTTAVLLEAIRRKTAPVAIITTAPDSFFALASIVADEMYGTPIPLVSIGEAAFAQLQSWKMAHIAPSGTVTVKPQSQS